MIANTEPFPKHNPPASNARPGRPVLKIPLPPNPWNSAPAPSDLTVLVAEALKARPSPRRNQPDFYFTSTTSNPVAPPPTPVHGGPHDHNTLSLSDWSRACFDRGEASPQALLTPGTPTPRGSGESERKVVRFTEDSGDEDGSKTHHGSGRSWKQ